MRVSTRAGWFFALSVALTVIPSSDPESGNVITVAPPSVLTFAAAPALAAILSTPNGVIQSCSSRSFTASGVGVAVVPAAKPAPGTDSFHANLPLTT